MPVLYAFGELEIGNGLALSDFNGDGIQDIATGSGYTNEISILLGNGDGTFQDPKQYLAASQGTTSSGFPGSTVAIAAADFNADGKPDLVVVNGGVNTVSILLGNGDGTFQAHVDYPTGTTPSSVTVGDFNGDGKLDLAVTNQDDNTVSILLGNGDGTFKTK